MKSIPGVGLFLLFLASGHMAFVVFGHYFRFYSSNTDLAGRIAVAVIFLGLALFTRSSERFHRYWLSFLPASRR